MQDIVPMIRVECHSALCGDTPIIMDNEIVTMAQVFMAHSATNLNSMALNSKGAVVNTHIMEIPQEITIPESVRIQLHYGLEFECSPGTLILTREGFKEAQNINKEDILDLIMFDYESGKVHLEDAIVSNIEKSSIIQVAKKAYIFISEHNNVLIPYYKEGSNHIGFICIKQ